MEEKKALSYEELIDLFERTDKRAAERAAEADKRAAESKAEFDKRMAALDEKLDKAYKTIVGVSDNSGHHAEQYFQDIFADKLSFGKIKYDYMQPNLTYQRKGESAEFDIALFNGKSVALIEAKHRIHPDFIKEFVENKTAQFRRYFPLYKDFDLYLGVAGFSFSKKVVEEAKKYGVGIIRQVGNAVEMDDKNLKVY
jgi:hypothetical protein